MLFNISASGSVLVPCYLVDWYCMYVSAITAIGFMWCPLHVMHLPLDVNCIVYDFLWWFLLPVLTTVPWVHGPPSSHWTTTADPIGIHENVTAVSLSFFCCLLRILAWWWSSQSWTRGLRSMTGIMLQTGLLNLNVARLGKSWPNGVVWIWRSAMFMSVSELAHF